MKAGLKKTMPDNMLKQFFFPAITKAFLIRIALVAATALILFGYVLTPFRISGQSMAPTYRDGSFNFCFRLHYLFSSPERKDIVTIRLAGESIMLLKRVVGLAGDVVAFKNGQLFVNGNPVSEPYLVLASDWNLPPRTVKPGHVYVVGDNRSVPIQTHQFGQTPVKRIVGVPLW